MIIKAVIFQGKESYGIVELKDYKRYIYENFITPQRLCIVEISQDFCDDIQEITNERLIEILDEELSENNCTLYSN